MESRFTSEFFAGNRTRLRELFTGTAPIMVTANGLLQRGGDSPYKFHQDANFWYLTGIDEPDITLVMDKGQEFLIVPRRSHVREAFDGSVSHEELSQRSGIRTIHDDEAGWQLIAKRLKKVQHVAMPAIPQPYIERYGLYVNPARAALVQRLKGYNDDLAILDISAHLSRLRIVKQPAEIAAIQSAINITIRGIKAVGKPAKLRHYVREYELEAELNRTFRRLGASGHAFEPVVASGERACMLHNVANEGKLSADELVVIDVGAEVDHYAADITRTLSLSKPTRRQQAVHAAVLEVQNFAFGLLKPGVLIKDYEQQIEHYMGEKLRELGLIKSISHEAVRQYYPHATSHFLGLNVHDIGDYERPLEPGVVMTVEPGIYIPAEGLGIRIEDDVLITPRGIKVLSAKLPRLL